MPVDALVFAFALIDTGSLLFLLIYFVNLSRRSNSSPCRAYQLFIFSYRRWSSYQMLNVTIWMHNNVVLSLTSGLFRNWWLILLLDWHSLYPAIIGYFYSMHRCSVGRRTNCIRCLLETLESTIQRKFTIAAWLKNIYAIVSFISDFIL